MCTKWPAIPCCWLRMQETSALVFPRQIWLRCSPSPSLWSRRLRTSPSSSGLFWGTQQLVVLCVQGQGWRSLTKKHVFVSLVSWVHSRGHFATMFSGFEVVSSWPWTPILTVKPKKREKLQLLRYRSTLDILQSLLLTHIHLVLLLSRGLQATAKITYKTILQDNLVSACCVSVR